MTDALLVGLAQVDITPPVGASLVGYKSRESKSIDMPLRAEAMVCRRGDDAWALVTCDVLGVAANLVAEIRSNVAAVCTIKESAIMISVTHTHSGPNTIARDHSKTEAIDQEYRIGFVEKISQVIIDAFNNAQASSFSFAHGDIPGFAHNRRIQKEDDEWGNEWVDLEGQHPGYVDTHLTLLAIRDAQKNIRGLLVNYACHPVTLGPQSLAISPDYVGYLKQALGKHFGIDHVAFCLAGAGNLNPRDCINEETSATKKMGEELAQKIIPYVDQLSDMNTAELSSKQSPWSFERTRQRPKDKEMKDEQQQINSEFQMFACDELAIISLPGELFCEFNDMLRAASAYPCTIVSSITNDYIGYLPTDKAIGEGAYEVNMAPADNLESMIMESCGSLLST